MFWIKKTLESAEFQKLYRMLEETRIKVETLDIELQLYKKKLRVKAGIDKEEEEKPAEVDKSRFNNPMFLAK